MMCCTFFSFRNVPSVINNLTDVNSNIRWVNGVCDQKYPVDFDDELKIGDVRYDNMI